MKTRFLICMWWCCITKRFLTIAFHKNTVKFPLILVNFGFCDQTFRPNFHCALHQKLKISTMLVEWVEKKKKCWANDAVNNYNTSKCEIFYSFFTNSQCHFCKVKSGRILARFFFNLQRWLGCEIQQVGTKPRKYSCRIDLRYGSKPGKFCHLKK